MYCKQYFQILLGCFYMVLSPLLVSQNLVNDDYPTPTSVKKRFGNTDRYAQLQKQSLISNLPSENIGPTVMSGRVTDIAANPTRSTHF